MQLTPTLITNIENIYGESGKIWLNDLPNIINKLSNIWKFTFLQPMPSLSYNFVGLVRLGNNQTAILKVAPNGSNLSSEIRWLNAVRNGVPSIYHFDEHIGAYLMEHLQPGEPLKNMVQAGNDDVATRILCQMIKKLQAHPLPFGNFPHLSKHIKDLNILENKFNQRLLSKAKSVFKDLTDDKSHDVLLHGDLHHDNILSFQHGWKAIDPHGYIGDPVAEVGPMFRNPLDCFPANLPIKTVIENRLFIMTEELPFDPQRMRDWAFCITVLSAAWSMEGHGKVLPIEIEVAEALNQLKPRIVR